MAELDATTLRIAFDNPALATTFRNGAHADVVARAVRETLGFDVRVEGDPRRAGAATGGAVRSDARRRPRATAATPAP